MTEKKEDLNPSKRTQESEDPILWKTKEEVEKYQKLYEAEYKKVHHWYNKECEMEKNRNEWRFFSILLLTVIITFSAIILRRLV